MKFSSRNDLTSRRSFKDNEHLNGKHPLVCIRNPLLISDIAGTKPFLQGYQYTNKPILNLQTADIGQTNNQYSKNLKNHQSLNIDDIEGARPNKVKFRTNRHINPLDPVYVLPSIPRREQSPFKGLVRDVFKIEKQIKKDKFFPKDEYKQQKKIYNKEGCPQNLQVKDINHQNTFASSRCSNPLDPIYDGYQDYKNSFYKNNLNNNRYREGFALSTRDIEFSGPNLYQKSVLCLSERKDFTKTNKIEDIIGSKAGTLVKGIRTSRQVNPVDPKYTFLGDNVIGNRAQHIYKDNQSYFQNNYKISNVF